VVGLFAAFQDGGRLAQIFDAGIGAAADKNDIDVYIRQTVPGVSPM
jgi:hypothetical protein